MGYGKKVLLAEINSLNPPEKYMQYAVELAESLNMRVHFVHVFNPDLYPIGLPYTTGEDVLFTRENLNVISHEIKENLENTSRRINDKFPQINTEISSEIGMSYDIIRKYEAAGDVDMVVIEGNTRTSELAYLTEEGNDILEKAENPVWIIPVDMDFIPFKRIVYATDYNEDDLPAIEHTIRIARFFSSEVFVVHVTEHNDFKESLNAKGYERLLTEKTRYDKIKFEVFSYEQNNLSRALKEYSASVRADLLVILKEKLSFFKRMVSGNNIKNLLKQVHQPLLVFHEK